MNKFKVGDRVRIVTNAHSEMGKLFLIEEVEGSDEVAHETPYRSKNTYWYKADDLVMVQPAYAKEYAIGAPATGDQQPTGDGAVDVSPSKIEQAAADLKTSVDIIAAKGIGSEVIQMNVDYLSQQLEIGKMPIATAIVLGDLLLMFEAILEMQAQATGE